VYLANDLRYVPVLPIVIGALVGRVAQKNMKYMRY